MHRHVGREGEEGGGAAGGASGGGAVGRSGTTGKERGFISILFFVPGRRIGSGSYIFSGLASKEKPINIEETDEKPVGEKERQKPLSSESASSIHGHTIEDLMAGGNQGC